MTKEEFDEHVKGLVDIMNNVILKSKSEDEAVEEKKEEVVEETKEEKAADEVENKETKEEVKDEETKEVVVEDDNLDDVLDDLETSDPDLGSEDDADQDLTSKFGNVLKKVLKDKNWKNLEVGV
jgi:hypothetical protein